MRHLADIPYYERGRGADKVDWFSDDIEDAIATAAMRWCVPVSDIKRRLEQSIPDGETPRQSVERVAMMLAEDLK